MLNAAQVQQVLALTRQAKFIDDRVTNKHNRAKQNMQMAADDPRMKESGSIIRQAMQRNQEHRMKGSAGDVVLYPSVSLHRVEPVTQGVREVAVTWFQSVLRDAQKREILYNL